MKVRKRLRRIQSQTSYQTKKQQVATEITRMRLNGSSVADIAKKYDIPPRVVERFCQNHLRELMPEFNDKEYQRLLRLGQLENLLQPKMEQAIETGDHKAHDLALKTIAQIVQVSGITDTMMREMLKGNGVMTHEVHHSGSIQLNHEIGQKAAEALEMFKARTAQDRELAIAPNTHTERTPAREIIDRQLRALPKSPPKDLIEDADIVEAVIIEEEA